jgi:hypothetical protein
MYVGVGQYGRIIVSEDGLRWKDPSPMSAGDMRAVVCGSRGFVAVGSNGTLFSEDGYKWTLTGFKDFGYNVDVAWGGDKYVLVSNNGTICTSVDGKQWIKQRSGSAYNLYSIAYGNEMFVTIGDHGMIMTAEFVPTISEPATGVMHNFTSSHTDIRNAMSYTGPAYSLNGRLISSSVRANNTRISSGRYVITDNSNSSVRNLAVTNR